MQKLSHVNQQCLVLFDPKIGLCQVLPLRAMSVKKYSAFIKAPALQEPRDQIVKCHIQDTRWEAWYPSAEKQLVYSLDWVK